MKYITLFIISIAINSYSGTLKVHFERMDSTPNTVIPARVLVKDAGSDLVKACSTSNMNVGYADSSGISDSAKKPFQHNVTAPFVPYSKGGSTWGTSLMKYDSIFNRMDITFAPGDSFTFMRSFTNHSFGDAAYDYSRGYLWFSSSPFGYVQIWMPDIGTWVPDVYGYGYGGGITITPSGKIYVAYPSIGNILSKTSYSDPYSTEWDTTLNFSGADCDTATGDVYFIVSGGDLWKQTAGTGAFTAEGVTARTWYDIAFDNSGNLWGVASTGAYIRSGNVGDFTLVQANSSTFSPRGIDVSVGGDIWTACWSTGTTGNVSKRASGGGSFSAFWTCPSRLNAITCDQNGNVYAASAMNVYRFIDSIPLDHYALTVNGGGVYSAQQIKTDIAAPTPPLSVVSAVKVDSLNSDMVDGKHASDFDTVPYSDSSGVCGIADTALNTPDSVGKADTANYVLSLASFIHARTDTLVVMFGVDSLCFKAITP